MNVATALQDQAELREEEEALVDTARAFVPRLREASAEIDRLARIPDDIADEFHKVGIYKMTIPRAYGGLETSISTWRRVVTEIGRGDAGAAWSVTLNTCCNWMASGFYPRAVTDRIFGQPGSVTAGVFSPRGVKARRVEGGIHVEKAIWFFNSGVPQANWDLLGVPLLKGSDKATDAGQMEGAGVALIPTSDLTLLNDWDASGLRGSGSMNVTMEDVFIPDEHIVDLGACTDGTQAPTFDGPLYRAAFAPTCVVILTFPLLGAGRHYLEEFLRDLPRRDIKLTPYDKQGEAPVTHIQVGMASSKLDAAELMITRACEVIDEWAARGEMMPMMERARIVRDSSYADQMVWEAVDLLSQASGGSFSARGNKLNRIWQEVKVGTQHPFITMTSNYESYGRLMCGVTPPLMPI